MELILGYEILDSYQRLPYKTWFALAEFIDNSIQSYRNHPELKEILKSENKKMQVEINFQNKSNSSLGFIEIKDNAWGMDETELKTALTLGKKPVINTGLSKYGLGLKTASFWFGKSWEIETTQYGIPEKFKVQINLNEILEKEKKFYKNLENEKPSEVVQFRPSLLILREECAPETHGTTIRITDLYRKFISTTVSTCKEYLSSIYRKDLEQNNLELIFQGEQLTWSMKDILSRLAIDENKVRMYRTFSFVVGTKTVFGWAGVLKSGGRKFAGFSLLQANRVIQGFPMAYKPKSIFGEDGGRNDLINQRLIGELNLDGFEVSHTKDQILFDEEEEVELEKNLLREIGDFKKYATDLRVNDPEEKTKINLNHATSVILNNLKLDKFKYTLIEKEELPEEIIEASNLEVIERISKLEHTNLQAKIGQLEISIILSESSSPYDPYLIVKARAEKNKLTIVLNKNHSYWNELDENSAFDFLLNCIYDGIAEWKANFILGSIDPSTIKMIKDHFLRLRLDILD